MTTLTLNRVFVNIIYILTPSTGRSWSLSSPRSWPHSTGWSMITDHAHPQPLDSELWTCSPGREWPRSWCRGCCRRRRRGTCTTSSPTWGTTTRWGRANQNRGNLNEIHFHRLLSTSTRSLALESRATTRGTRVSSWWRRCCTSTTLHLPLLETSRQLGDNFWQYRLELVGPTNNGQKHTQLEDNFWFLLEEFHQWAKKHR